jgi:adenine-specific DNA-methyltransferase
MNIQITNPRKALNKAFLKKKPVRKEIEAFKHYLTQLLDHTNDTESEEFHKNLVIDFLKKTYYDEADLFVNTKGRNDLVIHTGAKAKSEVGVIIETKKPTNKAEMLTKTNVNVKAFQELVLYYLRERITNKNLSVKHLIATNINEWFIFDATTFDRLFAQNKKFVRQFTDFEEGRLSDTKTDFFYKQIAQPFIAQLEEISLTYFDIRNYEKPLRNNDPTDDHKLIALFKLLAPAHLLKLPFANDSNSLNKAFYYELLHIIGLEETKIKNKKVIQRKPEGKRNHGSLLENAIRTLETEDRLRQVHQLSNYGNTQQEQLFGVALELCITWINRILFLKLLEAQLVRYHQGDQKYQFLNSQTLSDYDELNELFFEVLAKQKAQRPSYVADKFTNIPYLNSSLFEITEMESVTIRINSMKDRFELPLHPKTVLKDSQGKRRSGALKVLDYLFSFLDAYDFSTEGAEEIQEENKTLINSSVLGLIFEKINGYQDGAFFTPGFITMYMCHETLRRAVVQKFRESKHFDDFDSDNFSDLHNYLSRKYTSTDLEQANQLINSLKICDPAVGSGHFLVSALNELLTIKSELGILCDRTGKPLGVRLELSNDELSVQWHRNDEFFDYRPGVKENQLVQEALFHEKQTIIEGCLFGVDLNPNSVKICRLRLWVELLKHAYYKSDGELETLPNIDINIKQGDSLVSRFALDADLKKALRSIKYDINAYKGFVKDYQRATDKEEKRGLLQLIDGIKSDFRSEIGRNDPKIRRLNKLGNELYEKYQTGQLFELNLTKEQQKDKAKLQAKVNKLAAEIEEIKNSAIYQDAFEWRFEFPEVLDEEGHFVGFDVVLGNPPYIRQEEFSDLKPYLKEHFETFAGTADLLVYFIERSHQVLNTNGQFSFIISNKFMRARFGKALREWLSQIRLLEIIDFGDLPVFEEATTYPCILSWQKSTPKDTFVAANVPELHIDDFQSYLPTIAFTSLQSALAPEGWTLADAATQQLLEKLKRTGTPLGAYVNGKIFRGVLTGYNEAFVIDAATKDRLIAEDPSSAEVIKPFLAGRDVKRYQVPEVSRYLIFTRKRDSYRAVPCNTKIFRIAQRTVRTSTKRLEGK